MRQQDRTAAVTAASGVSVVALTAALVSFSHMRRLALEAGESQLASWLLPISIDGAIAAAVAVILADSRAGRRPAGLTWLLLALGLGCSLAGNIASAEPTMTARAVAAWPPVALALGIEVLAGLARHRDAARPVPPAVPADRVGGPGRANGRQAATAGNRPTAVAGSSNGSMPTPAKRPRQMADSDDVALIRQLDAAAPGGRASRLQIQQRLGCGGSKAARLAALARRAELVAASTIGGNGRGYPQDPRRK
jgi:hypothetical protein